MVRRDPEVQRHFLHVRQGGQVELHDHFAVNRIDLIPPDCLLDRRGDVPVRFIVSERQLHLYVLCRGREIDCRNVRRPPSSPLAHIEDHLFVLDPDKLRCADV